MISPDFTLRTWIGTEAIVEDINWTPEKNAETAVASPFPSIEVKKSRPTGTVYSCFSLSLFSVLFTGLLLREKIPINTYRYIFISLYINIGTFLLNDWKNA